MNKVAPFLLMALVVAASAQCSAAEPVTQQRVVVLLDYANANFVTKVNGKVMNEGLLHALSDLKASNPTAEAVLVVHEEATLRRIDSVLGVIEKAGFGGPKTYYFSKDRDWMAEITYGPEQRPVFQ